MKIGIYDVDKSWCEQMRHIVENYAKQMEFEIKMYFFDKKNTMIDKGVQCEFPDVLFLSLDEDGKESIEIAREINKKNQECQIVFYANSFEHVMDVYATDHIYFVIKEQFENRISEIFSKVKKKQSEKKKKHVFSVVDKKKIILHSEEIIYFERVKRRTKIISVFGVYEIKDKLKDLISMLPEQEFLRCHNSYIVYLPAVREVLKENLVMNNGDKVVISRSYQKTVKSLFN